ncbi:hypothetical protein B0H67DRAFT_367008 [Lasiosphaeris hirsuta]|uniref:Uncharacterized protein n=1 Tax=Lasiosphaeris hirsuta TaxID=260670 RepID=A0AA39ZWK8_9PEZI|nr:hypothetical protein B0H67DRAFT_367008 [Lasiosphaeris hirsuta]
MHYRIAGLAIVCFCLFGYLQRICVTLSSISLGLCWNMALIEVARGSAAGHELQDVKAPNLLLRATVRQDLRLYSPACREVVLNHGRSS